jgi:hypothetical protein
MAEAQRLVTLRSLAHSDDEPVLPRFAAEGPAFGDEVWDLRGAGLPARLERSAARIDFGSIRDDHWRLVAKEYFWARLNEQVLGSNRLLPHRARPEFTLFAVFVRWMLDPRLHPEGFNGRLSGLDHAQIDAFAEVLREGRSSGTVAIYLRLVERLHDYSPFLSHDGLDFHPWRNRPSNQVAGSVSGENKTPRIPQEVLGPFLHWALLYVDVASVDILAAFDELAILRRQSGLRFSDDDADERLVAWIDGLRRAGRGIPARPPTHERLAGLERGANLKVIGAECGLRLRHRDGLRALIGDAVLELGLEPSTTGDRPAQLERLPWVIHSKADVVGRVEHYIESRRGQGRGIPCWSEWRSDKNGTLNLPLIAAQVGTAMVQRHRHPEAFALIQEAAVELGVERGGMDTTISPDPGTRRPWRDRFGPNTVTAEAAHLRAACYLVCAYLSGMRDGEIMEIRRGAHSLERSADGVINRHRVRSLVSKGRPQPQTATWVVTEHVARALEVMERLDNSELVFASLPGHRPDAVNRLQDHVNRLSSHDAALTVPGVDGAPWSFDTRQFRRTLAWFIGAQPFGVWAGAVQFKHHSVRSAMNGIGPTVFEGYVGTTPSGFPTEVELAKQAAADLYVENLAAAQAHGAPSAGGGAKRINARLQELQAELGEDAVPDAGPRVIDGQRRIAMLRSVSHNLFVGPLTDCFFDPDVALCLRDQERSAAAKPIIGRCQPNNCRNSRIGEHHLAAREERLAQVRADLRTRDLPPLQRRHLTEQRDRLKAEIALLRQHPTDSAEGDQQ